MDTSAYYETHYDQYGCWWSIADEEAGHATTWVWDEFEHFLKDIDCRMTPNSEWRYNYPSSGVCAGIDGDYVDFEPVMPDETSYPEWMLGPWRKAYPRMHAMWEWLDKRRYHLDDAYWYWDTGYVKRKHRIFEKRWDVMLEAYEEFVDETLNELCAECESQLNDAYEHAYSEEVAEEWCRDNEEVMA